MKTALNYLRRYGKILAIAATVVLIGYLPVQAIRLVPDVIDGKGTSTTPLTLVSTGIDTGVTFTTRDLRWTHSDKNVWPDSAKYIITFNSGGTDDSADSCTFIIRPLIGYKTASSTTVWFRSTLNTDTLSFDFSESDQFYEWDFAWNKYFPPGMWDGNQSIDIRFEFTGGVNNDTTFILSEHLIPYVNEY